MVISAYSAAVSCDLTYRLLRKKMFPPHISIQHCLQSWSIVTSNLAYKVSKRKKQRIWDLNLPLAQREE